MKAAQLFDVSGLATIVTGAASGIGLSYAEAMADNGARVFGVVRFANFLLGSLCELFGSLSTRCSRGGGAVVNWLLVFISASR